MKQLVILSGPSCVGKTPLLKALNRVYPDFSYGKPILYTSRPPRSIEQDGEDFHFRTESEIRNLPANRFIVGPVRHLWQAIDLLEVQQLFEKHKVIVLEIYPTLGRLFMACPRIQELSAMFHVRTVFLAPVSDAEIAAVQNAMGFATAAETVAAIMTPKLISRYLQQGKVLTPKDLEDIRIRASMAYEEILMGRSYTTVLLNHDGEDSVHWRFTPPIGEAGETLLLFYHMLTQASNQDIQPVSH